MDNASGGRNSILDRICRQGDPKQLRFLLEHGCNPGTVQRPRPKAMFAAVGGCTEGHRKCVRELIKFNGNVNVQMNNRKTPLHAAVANKYFQGYAKLVRLLVDADADANATDANKDRPLTLLFYGDDSLPLDTHRRQALAILLNAGAGVNFALLGTGDTPLHLAVRRQDAYAVAMLLFKGADVKTKNSSGATPLQITANQFRGELHPDHAQVLQWLLRQSQEQQAGDTVDKPAGAAGRTSLHHAVEILLEYGASSRIRDASGLTAFELALQCAGGLFKANDKPSRIQTHVNIMSHLAAADAPANVEWPMREGRCVLDLACEQSSLRLLRALLVAKLPVDTVLNGVPVIHHTIRHNNAEGAKYLAKKGAFVDALDDDQQDAISAAIKLKRIGLPQYLVNKGKFKSEENKAAADAKVSALSV
ncbi:ankyrin [Apiospora phragmitis]|uniref:Ankyrin n=1 Tax=Apiospora phragmitis TaxID=2905665 RepID=A0ABR1W5D9_9PEZI